MTQRKQPVFSTAAATAAPLCDGNQSAAVHGRCVQGLMTHRKRYESMQCKNARVQTKPCMYQTVHPRLYTNFSDIMILNYRRPVAKHPYSIGKWRHCRRRRSINSPTLKRTVQRHVRRPHARGRGRKPSMIYVRIEISIQTFFARGHATYGLCIVSTVIT